MKNNKIVETMRKQGDCAKALSKSEISRYLEGESCNIQVSDIMQDFVN
jgi:diaminopimelate decarboxylase